MQIEFANKADIAALSKLLTILFSQEEEFQPDESAQRRGLEMIIADPGIGHIILARQGETIVGMVNLLYTVSTALGGKVAILEDMIVTPEARGSGAGSELLEKAVEQARRNDCLRITLLTDRCNEDAQRFYRRKGFTMSAMTPLRLMLNG